MSGKSKKKTANGADRIWRRLKEGDFSLFAAEELTDGVLIDLAHRIRRTGSFGLLFRLIGGLPSHGRDYDWNTGYVLSYFELDLIIDCLTHIGDLTPYHDSLGLAWALGEYRRRDPFVVDFLEAQVRGSKNSTAWWRAAHALDKLGVGDAITLMKRSLRLAGLKTLDEYLNHLDEKWSLIGVLETSDAASLLTEVYPRLKAAFLDAKDLETISNCAWLIGRLDLADDDILRRLAGLMRQDVHDLKYYGLLALERSTAPLAVTLLREMTVDPNPCIRRLAIRELSAVPGALDVPALEKMLDGERDRSVLRDICLALDALKNGRRQDRFRLELKCRHRERGRLNGGSVAEAHDPAIEDDLAAAWDPDMLAMDVIRRRFRDRRPENPTVLGCGTGRFLSWLSDYLPCEGTMFGQEEDPALAGAAASRMRREDRLRQTIEIVTGGPEAIVKRVGAGRSDLIIILDLLPSADPENRKARLSAAREILSADGEIFFIGPDGSWNDEIAELMFRHVPDGLRAWEFEEWRRQRAEQDAAGGPKRVWIKTGLTLPLRFPTPAQAARAMGYLFGRDAAVMAARAGQTEWTMSLGIARETKKKAEKKTKKKS